MVDVKPPPERTAVHVMDGMPRDVPAASAAASQPPISAPAAAALLCAGICIGGCGTAAVFVG